jgi:hypothetical protein
MNPKISVDYATLKSALRNGLSAEGREYWWPILSNITDQKFCMRDYPDVAGSAERLLVMSCSVSPMVTLKKETTPEKKYQLLLEALASAKSAGDSKSYIRLFLKQFVSVINNLFSKHSPIFYSDHSYVIKVLC